MVYGRAGVWVEPQLRKGMWNIFYHSIIYFERILTVWAVFFKEIQKLGPRLQRLVGFSTIGHTCLPLANLSLGLTLFKMSEAVPD
jgi:hypothetical protein